MPAIIAPTATNAPASRPMMPLAPLEEVVDLFDFEVVSMDMLSMDDSVDVAIGVEEPSSAASGFSMQWIMPPIVIQVLLAPHCWADHDPLSQTMRVLESPHWELGALHD
ncbi:hypothetical protein GGI22_005600, partial [Coemansia erecta]